MTTAHLLHILSPTFTCFPGSGPPTLEKNMESLWLVKCSTFLTSYLFTVAPSALYNQYVWVEKSLTAAGTRYRPKAKTMS